MLVPEQPQASSESTELFFQLSSADRRRILSAFQEENLKLNEVAKKLHMTATETLRQLQKLVEGGLLEKMPDGKYRLTPYSRIILDASSPLDFISRHREYFQTHDLFLLPCEFRARLRDLSNCEFIAGTIETINKVTEMFWNAEKEIASVILGTEALIEIESKRVEEGVKIKWLMHESFAAKAPSILRSWKELPEIRSTPSVFGHVAVTDKEALLTLRHNDGTMSYESFVGNDKLFMKWAWDLFDHEWNKAKPWYPYMATELKAM